MESEISKQDENWPDLVAPKTPVRTPVRTASAIIAEEVLITELHDLTQEPEEPFSDVPSMQEFQEEATTRDYPFSDKIVHM